MSSGDENGGPSPIKRPRISFNGAPKANREPVHRRYVLQSGSEKRYNDKFKTFSVRSTFRIEAIPANPEELLRALFQHCIDEALSDATQNGIVPDRLGATISSPLLDPDIWIGIRSPNANTAESILNRFMLVSQSKPKSLWSEPFAVSITTINRAALPRRDEVRGSGMTGEKRLHRRHHQVNQSSLLLVKNPPGDTRCLLYALDLTRRHNTHQGSRDAFSYYLNHRHDQQRQDVNALMRAAGIPFGEPDYAAGQVVPRVVKYWNQKYAAQGQRFKVFIFGDYGADEPEYMWGSADFTHAISLYHTPGHFDGIRHNVGRAVFGRSNYCFTCLHPYDRAIDHASTCKGKCHECGRIGAGVTAGPCKPEAGFESRLCPGCNKTFVNGDCWRHHLSSNYCNNSKRCPDCSKVYSVRHLNKTGRTHDCLKNYCRTCFRYHLKDDCCYITPIECKPLPAYRLIIYDFECTQDLPVPGHPQRFSHVVNFASLIVMCPACISSGGWRESLKNKQPCKVCGPHRTVTFSHRDFTGTEIDRKIVCEDPLEAFIDHLFNDYSRQFETVCFAHNAGRYDTVLMFKEIYNRGIEPSITRKGNKIYQIHVKKSARHPSIKFRDSLNLLPVSLERLVGAFGLDCGDKEFFPHAFNTTVNYDVILHNQLPPKEDYFYLSFPPEKKRRFEQWWEANQHLGFNLVEALPSYCCADVRILAEALVAFRQEWWEISRNRQEPAGSDQQGTSSSMNEQEEEDEAMIDYLGDENEDPEAQIDVEYMRELAAESVGMDVLYEAATISSASIKYFRKKYLKEEHLVKISNQPIDSADNQSNLALKFLEWYAEQHGVQVQTAHSPGGEKKFGQYMVDGYCELADGTRRIIEVNGDFWHACPVHYPDPEMVLSNGKTAGRKRADDERRLAYLRQCVDEVEVYWECQIKDMLRRDRNMRRAFSRYHDKGPIKIREAFMGGRTGAERMHFLCPEGWVISDLDCNSMYPHVMVTGSFPVSAPKVHVIPYPACNVNWERKEDITMKGILKVFVIPPSHHVDISVLPAKFDQRLNFAFCRTCALQYPEGGRMRRYSCQHSDEERGWVATLPHIELEAALDAGYRITRFYRALEFEKFDSGLFAPFVRDFMALKIENSGFPAGISTRAEEDAYIRECWDEFGIRVERDKMKPNKARRECAKLILNNIWAKFSQVPGLSKTEICYSPARLRKLLDDQKIEISAVDELNADCVMITYREIDEAQEEHPYHNPVVSLWCTSLARLQLLKKLQAISRDPNAILLYYDTDSALIAHREGHCPIESGPHLGQWKDELPDYRVVEFLSGGCKNYALRCIHRQTGEEKTILHVRGISLTADVCEKLHWDTFKECVMEYAGMTAPDQNRGEEDTNDGRRGEILIDYPRALRPVIKHSAVYTVPIQKRYRPVVTKGIVTEGGIIRPFGYRP